jgi:hypothetical protein
MWNWRYTAVAAALALVVGSACLPEDYPTEARFEFEPPTAAPGHLFRYNLLEDVAVSSVNIAGSFQDPQWDMAATPMDHTWLVTVELEAGTHEYKYVFNGDQWAGNMCNETTWGDPDNGNAVDPNGTGCVDGGENALIEVEQAGPHTFMYVVPDGAPEIGSLTVAGSFQGWNPTATPMDETFALRVDMEPGTYEYKFVFNGDQWAGNMCNDANWGDPDNGYMVDANGQGCADGGDNALLTIE